MSNRDLLVLARAVLDDYSFEEEHGRNVYNVCRHCEGKCSWNRPLVTEDHATNCPVLVAWKVVLDE